MMEARKFFGKVALITGGNRNTGKEIVEHLAKRGCNVIFSNSKDCTKAKMLAEEISFNFKVKSNYIACDLNDLKEVEQFAVRCLNIHGRVDFLINNAGLVTVSPVENTSLNDLTLNANVNYLGPFLLAKACIPSMKNNKFGRLIFISTCCAYKPELNIAAYTSSKHALHSLSKSCAKELGNYGITSNVIIPGIIKTDNTPIQEMAKDLKVDFETLRQSIIDKNHVTGKIVSKSEVANLVEFLCSDNAQNITGSEYKIDGGYTL